MTRREPPALSSGQLMLHPLRLRILRSLGGPALTPKQLQERLPDVAQATLYRHLKILEDAGVIVVVSEVPKRGTVEKSYMLAQASLSEAELATASAEDWQTWFQQFSAQLVADFARYIAHEEAEPLRDGVGFRQALLYLSPAEREQLVSELRAVLTPYLSHTPGPERQGVTLSTVFIPEWSQA